MTTIEKYVWLIGKLHTCNRRMTLSELNSALLDKAGETLDRKKLKKWRDIIEDMFNIEIKCKTKGREYTYYIENPEAIDGKSVESWILNTATVSNTLNTYKELGDRIVCDAVPRGTEYLEPILQAISAGIAVDIDYCGMGGSEWTFRAEPYAVRQHLGNWYVLCKLRNLDSLLIYSLGQMRGVHLRENDEFTVNGAFDARKYFEPYFGVVVNSNSDVCRTVIRAYGHKIEYLRANPLHACQKEIGGVDGMYADFEYNLLPTYDFANAVIGLGPMVKVLPFSPLESEIRNSIGAIRQRYESEDDDIEPTAPSPEPLLNGNFAVVEVDIANEHRSSIGSLCVVVVRNGNVVKKYRRTVRPIPHFYDEKYMEMGCLTEAECDDSPLFKDVWPEIERDIQGLPIVGYNVIFDKSALQHAFKANRMEWPDLKFYDAFKTARHMFDKELWTKRLQTVAGAAGASASIVKRDSLSIAEDMTAIALQLL